jgi:hypothetical protein
MFIGEDIAGHIFPSKNRPRKKGYDEVESMGRKTAIIACCLFKFQPGSRHSPSSGDGSKRYTDQSPVVKQIPIPAAGVSSIFELGK